jgi:hypothetical protein
LLIKPDEKYLDPEPTDFSQFKAQIKLKKEKYLNREDLQPSQIKKKTN